MKIFNILFLLVIFSSVAFSATYSADFKNERSHLDSSEPYHFNTGRIDFNAEMDCAIVSSTVSSPVLEGTLCDGPSTVCPGTEIRVTPEHTSRWGLSNPTIYSFYPLSTRCSMEHYTSFNRNEDVEWLSDSVYAKYDKDSSPGFAGEDFALYYEGPYTGPGLYSELGTFHSQSVTYKATDYDSTDPCSGPQYNKKAEGNVFCNGDIQLLRGSSVLSTRDAGGTLTGTNIMLTSEGTETLRARFRNTECFASLMKFPRNLADPSDFRLYFFGYGATFPTSINSDTVTINVEDRQAGITDIYVEITASTTFTDLYLITINVINNGDVPVRITGVNSPPEAQPLTFGTFGSCSLLGIPSPPCPSDNGFGDMIPVGDMHAVYVLYRGSLTGASIALNYQPFGRVCSDDTDFELDVDLYSDVASCEVEPPTLDAGPYEVHEYDVTCYNSFGELRPCPGDNWYWTDGLSGGFISRTSSNTLAYTTSSVGTSGRLCYTTDGVTCCSDVESSDDSPYFECELDPSSAALDVGESQWFDLLCYLDGAPAVPTSADYDNVDGLDGLISDSSTAGTNFTGTVPSDGNLRGIGWRTYSGDPTLRGAVAFSHINVGNVTGNETGDGDGGEEEDVCDITPSYDEKYPHDGGSVTVECGDEELGPCSSGSVSWRMDSELYGNFVTTTDSGATYTVGSIGTPEYGYYSAAITAIISDPVSGEVEGSCRMDILIKEPSCLEFA